jgi:hypothetical protein
MMHLLWEQWIPTYWHQTWAQSGEHESWILRLDGSIQNSVEGLIPREEEVQVPSLSMRAQSIGRGVSHKGEK